MCDQPKCNSCCPPKSSPSCPPKCCPRCTLHCNPVCPPKCNPCCPSKCNPCCPSKPCCCLEPKPECTCLNKEPDPAAPETQNNPKPSSSPKAQSRGPKALGAEVTRQADCPKQVDGPCPSPSGVRARPTFRKAVSQ